MWKIVLMILTAAGACALAGCDPEAGQPSVKQEQERKAADAANSLHFVENAEIDNIKRRLELTADPGKLGFIVLMNQSGQPILYEGIKGKVTSGGKRLTRPDAVQTWGNGNGGTSGVVRAGGSDEGTFGSSSQYIFYWNTAGVYRQWSEGYLYSDQPIRLRIQPLVIGVEADGK